MPQENNQLNSYYMNNSSSPNDERVTIKDISCAKTLQTELNALGPNVVSLAIKNCKLVPTTIRTLTNITKKMTSLKILDLSDSRITAKPTKPRPSQEEFHALCTNLQSLEQLILDRTIIDEFELKSLPQILRNNTNLASLHLFRTLTTYYSNTSYTTMDKRYNQPSSDQDSLNWFSADYYSNLFKDIIETFPKLQQLSVLVGHIPISAAIKNLRYALQKSPEHPIKALTLPLNQYAGHDDLRFIANRVEELYIPVSNISLNTLELALFQNTALKKLQANSRNISLPELKMLLHFLKKHNYCLIKFSSDRILKYSKANYPELSLQEWETEFGKLNEQVRKSQHSFDMLIERNKLLSSLPKEFSDYQKALNNLLEAKAKSEPFSLSSKLLKYQTELHDCLVSMPGNESIYPLSKKLVDLQTGLQESILNLKNTDDNLEVLQIDASIQVLKNEYFTRIKGLGSAYYPELVNHILQTNRELGEALLLNFPVARGIVKDSSKFLPELPKDMILHILSYVFYNTTRQNHPAGDLKIHSLEDGSLEHTGQEPPCKKQKANTDKELEKALFHDAIATLTEYQPLPESYCAEFFGDMLKSQNDFQ